jgi:hypothetical protein
MFTVPSATVPLTLTDFQQEAYMDDYIDQLMLCSEDG